MGMQGSRVVVGTEATKIAEAVSGRYSSVLLKNKTAGESIFLGGPSVTDADGFEWETGDGPISMDIPLGGLYGVVTTNDQTVHVLKISS